MKRKKLFALLMVLAMTAALIGCGSKDSASKQGSAQTESAKAGGAGAQIPGGDAKAATAAAEKADGKAGAKADAKAAENAGAKADGKAGAKADEKAGTKSDAKADEKAGAKADDKAAGKTEDKAGGKTGAEAETKAASASAGIKEKAAEAKAAAADNKEKAASGADAKSGKNKGKDSKGAKTDAKPEKTGTEHLHMTLTTHNRSTYNPDEYSTEVQLQWISVDLTEKDAAEYPKLAKSLENWNETEEKDYSEVYQELKDLYADYKADRGEGEGTDMYFESTTDGTVLRADSTAVSIYHNYYGYAGGVHGYYGYTGTSFDTETGRELLLTDVVKDMDEYLDLVEDKLEEDYEEFYDILLDPEDMVRDMLRDDPTVIDWAMDSEGVTIYFNPYVLGSYADGAQYAKVYFEEHPEVFNEKYRRVPESYFIPYIPDQKLEVDVDGDGDREEVYISSHEADDYGYTYSYLIHVGKRAITVDDGGYKQTSYLLKKNGKYYLYMFQLTDNDYNFLRVIDLDNLSYDEDGWMEASMATVGSEWFDTFTESYTNYTEHALTDPADFRFDKSMEILGTRSGDMSYKVRDDGYPVENGPWYELGTSSVIQAVKDVECESVDENGRSPKAAGKGALGSARGALLKAGTYVYAIRTDGKTWIDMQSIDASKVEDQDEGDYSYIYTDEALAPDYSKPIYRIYVDTSGWPGMINGVPEGEFFRGISYAG